MQTAIKADMSVGSFLLGSVLSVIGLALLSACASPGNSDPVVDNSRSSQALGSLPRPVGPRIPVTVYEIRSEVPEVNGRAATDMFTSALVKSGQFAVLERARLNQGVLQEKQKNATGQTTGKSGQTQLRDAQYVFEGLVSEASSGTSSGRTAFAIGGAQFGGGSAKDSIGVDVRIVNANTGEVLDAINVRKELKSTTKSVSGLGNLANTYLASKGKETSSMMPDVAHESARKESVDEAMRACFEVAVLELSKRFRK
jgi:curli biogenesis system outer membrane secretion channel CsgG